MGSLMLSHLHTFGTAAWKMKSVMGEEEELEAASVMAVTTGLDGLRSKLNTTFRAFFSNAVILGIPVCVCARVCVCVCVRARACRQAGMTTRWGLLSHTETQSTTISLHRLTYLPVSGCVAPPPSPSRSSNPAVRSPVPLV